jgi:hypothetical protein
MDFMDYFDPVWPSLLLRSPVIIAWIVAIVLAARMFKRDGGKSERLLLIGCSLMLAQQLISPFQQVLVHWLIFQHEGDLQRLGLINGLIGIPIGIISLAGIVCLVFAFWTRWKSHGATP